MMRNRKNRWLIAVLCLALTLASLASCDLSGQGIGLPNTKDTQPTTEDTEQEDTETEEAETERAESDRTESDGTKSGDAESTDTEPSITETAGDQPEIDHPDAMETRPDGSDSGQVPTVKPNDTPGVEVIPGTDAPTDPVDPSDPSESTEANPGFPEDPTEEETAPAHEYLQFERFPYEHGYTVWGMKDTETEIRDVVIPAEIGGKPVLGIGSRAFAEHSEIRSVTLPEGLQFMDYEAFVGCSGLERIEIPASVVLLRENAFQYCTNLTEITVAEGNPLYTAAGNCIIDPHKRELVLGCNNSTIPADQGILTIGLGAFAGCETLTSLTIPEGVIQVGVRAFEDCPALSSVVLPETLEIIEYRAFAGCGSLSQLTIPQRVYKICEEAFDGCGELLQVDNGVQYVGLWAVRADTTLTEIYFREDTQGIASYAFADCSRVTDMYIPNNIRYICEDVFDDCPALRYNTYGGASYLGNSDNAYVVLVKIDDTDRKTYTIHESTQIIHERAFFSCLSLQSLEIPEGVRTIGAVAFGCCMSLYSLHIPASVTFIDYGLTGICTSMRQITVAPENTCYFAVNNCLVETDTGRLIATCTTSEIPEDSRVTGIGRWTWFCTDGISDMVIPENIEILYPEAVTCYDNALTSVTMADSVTYMGDGTFSGCSNLQRVELSQSLTEIGNNAFSGCYSLRSLVLPEGVLRIGENAFSDCEKLVQIYIPGSVRYIDHFVFAGCERLAEIEYGGTVAEWNAMLKGEAWGEMWETPCVVRCIDGDITLNAAEAQPEKGV